MVKAHHPVRIVIADDYSVVREGLIAIIQSRSGMTVSGQCGTWPIAVKQVLHLRPDIVLSDLHMPGGDAPASIATIRTKFSEARIIVLADSDTDEEVYQCIRAGARGYVLKAHSDRENLFQCIDSVLMGHVWIHPSAATRLAERMNAPVLTKREKEIIQMMVAGRSNKEIGNSLNVTEGTVKVHLNHVFAKLGVSSRVAALAAAVQHGLATLPPPVPLASNRNKRAG